MHLRQAFLWTVIASLGLAAAMGIVAVLSPSFGRREGQILLTTLVVGAFSVLALACSIALGRRRFVTAMWVGIGAAMAAMTAWMPLIWFDAWRWGHGLQDLLVKTAITLTVTAVWGTHLGLLALPTVHRPLARRMRWACYSLAGTFAAFGVVALWVEWDDQWAARTAGVLSILVACLTIVSPVLALIEFLSRRGERESVPSKVMVRLACPRCGREQSLSCGHATCEGCGLRIDIDVEEPRCACGYLLYQLKGEQCPECGRDIPEQDRWSNMAGS